MMKPALLRMLFSGAATLLALGAQLTSHAQSIYQRDLRPLVQQYCATCHGGRGGRGGVNFTTRGEDGDFVRDPVFWKRVIQALEDRTMPEDAPKTKFTEVERQHMIQLIRQCLRNPDFSTLAKDPGPAPLRLLTQYEYACTMRDLLGVTDLPLNKLPGDNTNPDTDPRGDAGGMSPFLMGRYVNVAEDILDALPRERIVTVEPSEKLPKRDAARQSLKQIQTRAFRRPTSDEDMERLMALFDRIEELGKPYDETLKITLTGVLASAKFISHVEQAKRGDGPQHIDQYDLASRISYFIWSSMPDEPLLKLAEQGKLADPAVIEEQVHRMMADPKSRALAENFGQQWLGLANLRIRSSTTQPATQPITQAQLDAMRDQSVRFVDSILRQDKSLLALLDDDRGGVLGLSGVYVVTAAGERTSPPRRGKWVLETLLGQPVSPGLYNSCRIQKDVKGPEGAALRGMLATARQQAECAACHDRLDPPGLAMEGFDAYGRERAQDGDIGSLKKSLLAQKEDFIRNIVERMLGFALGRPIEPCDQLTVKQICESLARQDYRSSALVLEIAQSYPFNYRRPQDD